jgi:tetratricopeptide (TPR) repeat protein
MILRLLVSALLVIPAFAQQAIELSLSANGQSELTWYRGGTLLLEAAVFLWDGVQATVEWPAPLQLVILDTQGNAQTWPLESLASTSGPIVLTEAQTAFSVWGISGDGARAIPEGQYTLQVAHPAAGASRRVVLNVTSDSGVDDQMLRGRVASRYWEYKGDQGQALSILISALDNKPDDIGGLSQKADLLDAMGRTDDAIAALQAALNAFGQQYPNASHPPKELSRQLDELLAKANP